MTRRWQTHGWSQRQPEPAGCALLYKVVCVSYYTICYVRVRLVRIGFKAPRFTGAPGTRRKPRGAYGELAEETSGFGPVTETGDPARARRGTKWGQH